jgi:hypothetical protein
MEPCKFEKEIIEMCGDVKVLVSEFKAMNGSLRDTRLDVKEHTAESKDYRNKVNILWSSVHTAKWAVGLLFGAGMLWKVLEFVTK